MVLQVHECGAIALFTGEEVLINAQLRRTGPARALRDALLHQRPIPAHCRRVTDAMVARGLALPDTAFVGFKNFQPIGFGRPQARQNTGKTVPEIPATLWAMVLGHAQVQHHDLVALAGVFEGASVRGLDAYALVLAMDAGRARRGTRPDVNILVTFNALYPQPGKA